MIIAYVDESGDTGPGSLTYTLGCVFIEAKDWPNVFDELIQFRRRLKEKYGVPSTAEIKADYLIRSSGPLGKLNLIPNDRKMIYRSHLKLLAELEVVKAFAVVVHKKNTSNPKQIFDEAWITLLQRLERTSRDRSHEPVMILHDNGENLAIRRLARWSRRRLSAGSIDGKQYFSNPFFQLIDDPIPKNSSQSVFIQLADLVGYAAFRNLYVPGKNVANVVDVDTWKFLGPAVFTKVNFRKTLTTPGIVERNL